MSTEDSIAEIERVGREWPDGVHTCAELQLLEPGRRSCSCGRCDRRACFICGKMLMAAAGFIETIAQPDGRRRDFCSRRCLREHLTEDEQL